MKWKNTFGLLLLPCLLPGLAMAQKKVGEITVVYNYSVQNAASKSAPGFTAINTNYIKGNMSRSEIVSGLASFTIIHDASTGTSVVLREVNGQKLLIRMTAENWLDKNKRYEGIRFTNTSETKTIAGYKCMKATGTTHDSLNIVVYYTRDITPDNKDYEPEFKNLDGLPLEYDLIRGSTVISYTLASINLNPVPASKFDIPKSGYREMTYEESKKLNPGG
jgi:GLPGLI family protein